MRDIGVFTSKSVPTNDLVDFVRSYSSRVGQPLQKQPDESVVGTLPDVLYVFDATNASNGYFSEEERKAIESKLGSAPEGYVSIHFTLTDTAFTLADKMAHEVSRIWRGIIDYSGAGGDLGIPPKREAPGSDSV